MDLKTETQLYSIHKKSTLKTQRGKKKKIYHIDNNSKKIRIAIFILNIIVFRINIIGSKNIKIH